MCTQGNPLCSKGETDHGLLDPKTSNMPNIPTRASSNEYKEIPKSIQDKAREGEKNPISLLKEIKRENHNRTFEYKLSSQQI